MAESGDTRKNALSGALSQVSMDGELPRREDLWRVFDELDFQMACQVYLWSLPLVSYAQWKNQHYEVFGATSSDLVHYVSYRDRLGLITANATTPYILNFFDLNETGPLVVELPPGSDRGRPVGLLAARVRGDRRDGSRRRTWRPPCDRPARSRASGGR